MPEELTKTKEKQDLKSLLKEYVNIPKVGDVIKGRVISASKNEVILDIENFGTGIVRGRERYAESSEYANLKPGGEAEATVLELENEKGQMELSFRYAGHQKAWTNLQKLLNSGEMTEGKVINANKGGLMINVLNVIGFLPVSQLNPEHYPRVQGGDKSKILERLKELIGKTLNVKVLDAVEREEKLIVSEKTAWEEQQQDTISKYKVGDVIEGEVTAVTNFGAFVKFNNLEGLVHISEIAWQRIDDPKSLIKVGEKIKAEIINIDGSKIFLSMKKLKRDPWHDVAKKYKVGQVVKGKMLKFNPFGLFVELDKNIHGLAHISELSDKLISNLEEVTKIGEELDFKIISIEPEHHRLGLSIKALKEKKPAVKQETREEETKGSKDKTEKSEKSEEKTQKETQSPEGKTAGNK